MNEWMKESVACIVFTVLSSPVE